jgi:integrase
MEDYTGVPTLSDAISRLEEHPSLKPTRRRDLASSIRGVCEKTDVDPRITPASLRLMRPKINEVRPAKYNMRPKTWANLRANFRAALVHALPRPPRQPDPLWEKLRTAIPNRRIRKGLSRFISFCEREGIPPHAVSDAVMARFLAHLESDTLVTDPRALFRCTCRLWNAAAEIVIGWPEARVSLPNHRKPRRTLPLSSFPAEFQRELDECLAPPQRGNRFAKDGHKKILRSSTIEKIRYEIVLALSALVEAGWDPARITSLKCLFEPDVFEIILRRYCNDDAEQTPRPTSRNLASTLIGLAKRALGSSTAALEQVAELRPLQLCLGPQRKCMTAKNRNLMLELSDPVAEERLLTVALRLADWAKRTTPRRGAVVMEIAVAIAILLNAPIRVANLAGLRIGTHLIRHGGPGSLWFIDIPEHEVKNRRRLIYELSRRVTTLIDRYIRDYRPLIAEPGNTYLFPVGSAHKSPPVLSQQIRWTIADWVGDEMTAHQFRHFACLMMPDEPEALAELLGHNGTETVRAYYREFNTLRAGRRFDAIIEAKIAKAPSPRRRR